MIVAERMRRRKHRDRCELQIGDRGEEERLFGSVTNLGQWDWATRTQVDEVRTTIVV